MACKCKTAPPRSPRGSAPRRTHPLAGPRAVLAPPPILLANPRGRSPLPAGDSETSPSSRRVIHLLVDSLFELRWRRIDRGPVYARGLFMQPRIRRCRRETRRQTDESCIEVALRTVRTVWGAQTPPPPPSPFPIAHLCTSTLVQCGADGCPRLLYRCGCVTVCVFHPRAARRPNHHLDVLGAVFCFF